MPASIAASTRTPVGLQCRLGLLLFGEFAVWGLWFVSLGSWLGTTLRFSGPQIGMIYGTFALAGIVTPTVSGVIADQLTRSERMLAALHAAGGVMLLIASRQESFGALYAAMLLYAFCYLPTISLATSLSMRHLKAAASEYPRLRTLGTLGWIVAGLTIGALGLELSPRPMQMAGVASLLLGAYCLTLPATPPLAGNTARRLDALLGLDALALLRDPLFALFGIHGVGHDGHRQPRRGLDCRWCSRHLYVECCAARLARDLAGGRRRLERGDDRYPVVLANQ